MGRLPNKEAKIAKKGLAGIYEKPVPFHDHDVLPLIDFPHHVKENLWFMSAPSHRRARLGLFLEA
jgi:hypothetical protein